MAVPVVMVIDGNITVIDDARSMIRIMSTSCSLILILLIIAIPILTSVTIAMPTIATIMPTTKTNIPYCTLQTGYPIICCCSSLRYLLLLYHEIIVHYPLSLSHVGVTRYNYMVILFSLLFIIIIIVMLVVVTIAHNVSVSQISQNAVC